ncbi:hypothetical protein pb186bvf_007122 [Paramecium bursaria]
MLQKYEKSHTVLMARLYIIMSFTIMSVNNTLFKHSKASVFQIANERAIIMIVINTLFYPGSLYLPTQYKALLYQGIAFAVSNPLFFLGIRRLTLAEGVIISQTNTIWSQFLAVCILNEKLKKSTLIEIGLSMFGIYLITKPPIDGFNNSPEHLMGCLLALGSSIFQALSFVTIKLLDGKDGKVHPIVIGQYFQVPLAIISAFCYIYFPYTKIYNIHHLFSISGMVICTYSYTFLQYKAMQMVSFSQLAPFTFVIVIDSLLQDLIVFQNIPSLSSIIGGLIIISSMFLAIYSK